MANYILTDTCFWIGLFDETDGFFEKSMELAEAFKNDVFIIPWPCLYETISDKMIGNRKQMIAVEQVFVAKSLNVHFFDDTEYKVTALNKVFDYNKLRGTTFSLADSVIREIILDKKIMIDGIITYNEKDFKDVCDIRGIEIQN